MIKKEYLLLVSFLVFLLFVSCSNESKIKAVKPSEDKLTGKEFVSGITAPERENALAVQYKRFQVISNHNWNNLRTINDACAAYQEHFGYLPDNLEIIIDNILIFWPGCVFNNKPYIIIQELPDPDNPDDVGKIFYEKINQLEARVHYLDYDIENSLEGQIKWKRVTNDIELFFNPEDLNPDGTLKGSIQPLSRSEEEKYSICFRELFFLKLKQILVAYLKKHGDLPAEFSDVLTDRNYYVFVEGLSVLKDFVNNQNMGFDLGAYGDNIYYCDNFIFSLFKEGFNQKRECMHVDDSFVQELTGDILYNLNLNYPCPDSDEVQSLFNSDTVNSYEFPEDILKSKDDVQ